MPVIEVHPFSSRGVGHNINSYIKYAKFTAGVTPFRFRSRIGINNILRHFILSPFFHRNTRLLILRVTRSRFSDYLWERVLNYVMSCKLFSKLEVNLRRILKRSMHLHKLNIFAEKWCLLIDFQVMKNWKKVEWSFLNMECVYLTHDFMGEYMVQLSELTETNFLYI